MATRETDWTVVLGSSRSSLKVSPLRRAACSIRDPIRLRLKSCLVANRPFILSALFPGFLCRLLSTHGKDVSSAAFGLSDVAICSIVLGRLELLIDAGFRIGG